MRLDHYLVLHHSLTRNKAQQLIESGLIMIDAKICNKSSQLVGVGSIVTIMLDRRVNWVSRSAEKLARFLEYVEGHSQKLKINGATCLDVGSSTGGFSQVLLNYGASHIDAVDVGTNQLHRSLRDDTKVTSYEKTDIRDFAKIKREPYNIIVCDASFISLSMILDAMISLACSETILILLYKPQFEVGREHLRKTGVPKDLKIVESKMKEFEELLENKNIKILQKRKSSLIGEAGNQEWIYMLQNS